MKASIYFNNLEKTFSFYCNNCSLRLETVSNNKLWHPLTKGFFFKKPSLCPCAGKHYTNPFLTLELEETK